MSLAVKISLPTLVNSQAVKLASPPHRCLYTENNQEFLSMGSNFVLSRGGGGGGQILKVWLARLNNSKMC